MQLDPVLLHTAIQLLQGTILVLKWKDPVCSDEHQNSVSFTSLRPCKKKKKDKHTKKEFFNAKSSDPQLLSNHFRKSVMVWADLA